MDPDLQLNERRLQRRSRLAAQACRATGVAIPALLVISWLSGEAPAAIFERLDLASQPRPSSGLVGLAAFVSLLPALATGRALFAAATCFAGFARADWFGPQQPVSLSRAGRWLALSGVLAWVVPTLLGLILTANAAPGARVLTISLSSAGLTAILFGVLLWVLGHLWTVARSVADENARFV